MSCVFKRSSFCYFTLSEANISPPQGDFTRAIDADFTHKTSPISSFRREGMCAGEPSGFPLCVE